MLFLPGGIEYGNSYIVTTYNDNCLVMCKYKSFLEIRFRSNLSISIVYCIHFKCSINQGLGVRDSFDCENF